MYSHGIVWSIIVIQGVTKKWPITLTNLALLENFPQTFLKFFDRISQKYLFFDRISQEYFFVCASSEYIMSLTLQARIEKKLDEELPQEWMGGMKLGPKVSGNQGLSKS